jgi:hypothetical protein
VSENRVSAQDQAYIDGQVAFLKGAQALDNPYSFLLNPRLAIAWMKGWRAAFASEAERKEE